MSKEGITALRARANEAMKAGSISIYTQLNSIADQISDEHNYEVEQARRRLQWRTEELHTVQLACKRHRKRIKELEEAMCIEGSFNEPIREHLVVLVDVMAAGMSAEEITKAAKLTTQYGDITAYIDRIHEENFSISMENDHLKGTREGWVQLPKDKNGATLDPKDQPLMTPNGLSKSWSVEYDGGEWFLYAMLDVSREGRIVYSDERRFKPSECELVKVPYDKHGRTIEAGMWLKHDNDDVFLISDIIRQTSGFIRIIDSETFPGDSPYWGWSPAAAIHYEIVPEPDTQDRLESDVVDIAKSIAEDARRGLAQESVIERLIIACLARQKALDGVSS